MTATFNRVTESIQIGAAGIGLFCTAVVTASTTSTTFWSFVGSGTVLFSLAAIVMNATHKIFDYLRWPEGYLRTCASWTFTVLYTAFISSLVSVGMGNAASFGGGLFLNIQATLLAGGFLIGPALFIIAVIKVVEIVSGKPVLEGIPLLPHIFRSQPFTSHSSNPTVTTTPAPAPVAQPVPIPVVQQIQTTVFAAPAPVRVTSPSPARATSPAPVRATSPAPVRATSPAPQTQPAKTEPSAKALVAAT